MKNKNKYEYFDMDEAANKQKSKQNYEIDYD
jgi:hypothetical protein